MYSFNLLLLAGGLLVFISLLGGLLSARAGLPFLLVFLIAGMLVGVDGPVGTRFDNPVVAAWVGNAALAVILLEGGISTRREVFRSGVRPAALLATLGVVITAAIVGLCAVLVMKVEWRYGLLLGAIVGSTDAAAVFSVLRQTGLRLGGGVAATLEIESGLNDPMAVFLVLALVAAITTDAGFGELAWLLVRQIGLGAVVGLLSGRGVAWLLRRLPVSPDNSGPLSLVVVSGGMLAFALAGLGEGSGFLAIYLYGLELRHRAGQVVHATASAIDGFAWAAQALLFLLLGMLVAPHDLLKRLVPTLSVIATLIFIARPVAVWLCLRPFGFRRRERLFVGWAGLRGAVPIVLALYPLMARLPDSYRFFNVAFVAVIASLLLQGTTLGWVARRLRMVAPDEVPPPEERAVQGWLALDADLELAGLFGFLQLPAPPSSGATLGDWLAENLARDPVDGDEVEWHGATFRVIGVQAGRIVRVRVAQLARAERAPTAVAEA